MRNVGGFLKGQRHDRIYLEKTAVRNIAFLANRVKGNQFQELTVTSLVIGNSYSVSCCWSAFHVIVSHIYWRQGKLTFDGKKVSLPSLKAFCVV